MGGGIWAFLLFVLSSGVAVACSSERVLGGGEMRPLLVICGGCQSWIAVSSGVECQAVSWI